MMTELHECSPLFMFKRKDCEEVVVHGLGAIKTQGQPVQSPFAEIKLCSRSLLKPWYYFISDVGDQQSASALALASHSGEAQHIEALKVFLKAYDLEEADLLCPEVMPMSAEESFRLQQAGEKKAKRYHPCSGKHAALLAACKVHGYDKNYLQEEHPLNVKLRDFVAKTIPMAKVEFVKDSCGLLSLLTSVEDHLMLWEELALENHLDMIRIKTLWILNPDLIGGAGRLDSAIIRVGDGMLLAKEGADGLLMVQSLPALEEPAQSCLIKLSSGYHSGYLGIALWATLKKQESVLNRLMSELLSYLEGRLFEWVPADQSLVIPE